MVKHHDPEMTRLEELRLQRELKEVLLEYVHTLYTASHPSGYGFAILVCRNQMEPDGRERNPRRNHDDEYIMIRAIAYNEPEKRSFTLLAQSSKAQFGITPALQEFSKDLERQMGDLTGMLSRGEKRRLGGLQEGTDRRETEGSYRRGTEGEKRRRF